MRLIEQDTVFVLGAGASADYGYPTGPALRDIIVSHAAAGGSLCARLQELGYRPDEIEAFRIDLQRSGRYSVDAFLEGRREHVGIGKAAIAICLIQREEEEYLFNPIGESNWYPYLLEKMRAAPDLFIHNKLSIITFNYDRSFEHYVRTSLCHAYGDANLADRAAASIPVVHVHGNLGSLPWQKKPNPRPYGADDSLHAIRQAASGIKIMHEADGQEGEYQEAWNLLRGADRVYVLGFGYAEENCLRLGLGKLRSPAQGMAFGMRAAEVETARRVTGSKVQIIDRSLPCEAWLREHVELTAPKN